MSVRIFAFPTGRQGPRHEAALRATRIHSTKSEYGPGTRLHRGCRIGGRVSDGGRDGDDVLAIGLRGGLPETSRAYQDHRHHGEKQAIKRRSPRRVDEGGRRWGSAGSRAGLMAFRAVPGPAASRFGQSAWDKWELTSNWQWHPGSRLEMIPFPTRGGWWRRWGRGRVGVGNQRPWEGWVGGDVVNSPWWSEDGRWKN